jgi:hypothetical protein
LVRDGELHDNTPHLLHVERTPKVLSVAVSLTATVRRRADVAAPDMTVGAASVYFVETWSLFCVLLVKTTLGLSQFSPLYKRLLGT